MKLKRSKTNRGFTLIEFKDLYDINCSIQESSLATDDAIWFGIENADPKICIQGKGWTPVAFPEGTLFSTRMHLNKKQIKTLLKILTKFIDSGRL